MKMYTETIEFDLQLFAGETIPEKKEDANLDNKADAKQEPVKETLGLRKLFGLKDKEPEKKEPEKKEEPEKKPEEKQEANEPENKPEGKKDPETKESKKELEEKKEEEFITIKHLGKEVKIPASEKEKYIQMGYDYPHIRSEYDKNKATLLRIAKLEGFNSVDEYLKEIDNREKAKLAEQIEEAAGDPNKIDEIVKNHPIVKETAEEKRRLEFQKIRDELSKDMFFKELEPQFDDLVAKNPNADPVLIYKIIRSDYLTPEKLNEIMQKTKESAEKKALAEVHDKERRGAPTGGDTAEGNDTVIVSSFTDKLGSIFGLPKEAKQRAAQRAYEKLRRS